MEVGRFRFANRRHSAEPEPIFVVSAAIAASVNYRKESEMGGVGSGRRPSVAADHKAINAARLRIGRALAFAAKMGREPVFDTADVRTVLFGILEVQVENRNLVHDLRRVMERENALLNEVVKHD